MNEQQRDLDRRIRRAQRAEFFRHVNESKAIIVLGVFMIAIGVLATSFAGTPTRLASTVVGHVVSEASARANKQGQVVRNEIVKLDNGAVIDVAVTHEKTPAPGDAIKIEVYQKDWGPLHQTSYRFAGFADGTPAS